MFGNFSLEFPVDSLRSLGALPVIYMPDAIQSDKTYHAIGTSLLANLAAAAGVIAALTQTANFTDQRLEVDIGLKDGTHISIISLREKRLRSKTT